MSQRNRAQDWLAQAENDFEWAEKGNLEGFYSQVCFLCQQSAEKAIKSLGYFNEYEIKGHSIAKIAKSMGINSDIEKAGKELDIYYITSRYPDAFPEGAPFEMLTQDNAKKALEDAKKILIFVRGILNE